MDACVVRQFFFRDKDVNCAVFFCAFCAAVFEANVVEMIYKLSIKILE